MAKKLFLADIDLNKNQLLNTRLQNLPSHPDVYAPTSDTDPNIDQDLGLLYWNTTDKTAFFLSGYTPITLVPIWKSLGSGASSGVFSSDITFSVEAGKTLGKYVGGTIQTIPAFGKTFEEVMKDIALEALTPTASLSITSGQPEYNSTDIINTLAFSYTIRTAGATIAVGYPLLEFKRGNTNTWTTLTNAVSPYTHSNLAVSDKVSSFDYRYTVIDSLGASSIQSTSVTPKGYVAPSVSAVTSDSKEIGDIAFTATRSIIKNSVNTTLSSWQIVAQINGGSLIALDSPSSFASNPSITISTGGTINGTTIPGILSATNIKVYIRVIDSISQVDLITFNRNLELKKFYGSTASTVTNYRTQLTQVPLSTTSLVWYASGKVHTIALPTGRTLTSVMTSNNENVTSNFVAGLNPNGIIPDAGGTNRTYNIYTYITAVDFNVTLTAIIQ